MAYEWPGTVKGCYEPPEGITIDTSKEMIYHEGGKIFPISDLKDENDCKFVIDALPPKKINEFGFGKLCGRRATKAFIEFERPDPKTLKCAENLVPCTINMLERRPDEAFCVEKGTVDENCPILEFFHFVDDDSENISNQLY